MPMCCQGLLWTCCLRLLLYTSIRRYPQVVFLTVQARSRYSITEERHPRCQPTQELHTSFKLDIYLQIIQKNYSLSCS